MVALKSQCETFRDIYLQKHMTSQTTLLYVSSFVAVRIIVFMLFEGIQVIVSMLQ